MDKEIESMIEAEAKKSSQDYWKEKEAKGQTEFVEVVDYIVGHVDGYIAGRSKNIESLESEMEKRAIQFATWVENNGYVRFDKYYWINDECETRLSDDQLYHKFKQLLTK